MLALVAVAGTYDGPTDMSADRALNPVPVETIAPLEALRAPIAESTAAMAVTSPSAAAETTRARNDTRAIQAVLNRYRDAVSILDVTAVRAVWPSADAGVLRREFAALVEHNLEFDACRIASTGRGATASCAGVIESGFSAGNRRPRVERTRWQFTLHKSGDRWTITEVRTQLG